MAASFQGSQGSQGSQGNQGYSGNASAISDGWFFADRVDLPFVTALVSDGPDKDQPVSAQRIIIKNFPLRNWSSDWYAWLALTQFAPMDWQHISILPPWAGKSPNYWSSPRAIRETRKELNGLVKAARDERADALDEILVQSDEFMSYFMNLMTGRPAAYPATARVLSIASLTATLTAMYYKGFYQRPRPSQLCPALLPPITVPGHASFPSGHSTQAHLMALCMGEVLKGFPQYQAGFDDLITLADRIARNREIAGFHYPSDSHGGRKLAAGLLNLLQDPTQTYYLSAFAAAQAEWDPALN